MATLLQGLPQALCYISNVIVTGSTDEEHLATLEEVLRQLRAHGFRLKTSNVHIPVIGGVSGTHD